MTKRTTLVLGASTSTFRYSFLATQRLLGNNEGVYLLGKAGGEVSGHKIHKEWPNTEIHTVTMYLNPRHQAPFYEHIINSKPQRVIFNPGSENPELAQLLEQAQIPFEHSCTLVLLSSGQY
mgnify:CR=1 FL=1